ncbi:unnamed protein product [Alternaria alternata]
MLIKNVILAGASGNLGRAVIPDLLNSDLSFTILSRIGSSVTFSGGANVVQSNYDLESLIQILKGQDAVVSMLGITAMAEQKILANAAIAAGVKLFIPSEFGSDTMSDAVVAAVPFFKPKKDFISFLQTNEEKMSWTGIVTGLFFDWSLKSGLCGFDIPNKTATLIDGGRTRFTATNIAQIARTIIAVLEQPDTVANKFIHMESLTVSQLDILAALQDATGEDWTIKDEGSDGLKVIGFQKLQKGDAAGGGNVIIAAMLSEAALGDNSKTESGLWKERLDLPKENLGDVVRTVLECM